MPANADTKAEEASAPRRSPVLVACLIATFASAIESTIVATAMPAIVATLGDFSLFAWAFSIYMLGQAVSIPLFGRLADRFGQKRVFYAGTGLFLIGSTFCGLATTMLELILFRLLQGLGAGGLQPIANTIVGDLYSSTERVRMHGLMSSVYGISAVVGPSLGSFLVGYESWRFVFWINLPICALSIGLIARFLNENAAVTPRRVSYMSSLLLMLGMIALFVSLRVLILDVANGVGIGNGVAISVAAVGFAMLIGVFRLERRAAEPLLPIELWRNRVIWAGSLGGGVAGALMMGVAAYLPPYLSGVMHRSAVLGGLVLGTMSVLWTIASIGAGSLLRRFTYRGVAMAGTMALLAGTLVFVTLSATSAPLITAIGSGLIGIGMGMCATTFIVSIQSAVPYSQRGAATSSVMFMRCLGQAVGVAAFGAIVNLTLAMVNPDGMDVTSALMHATTRQSLSPAEATELTSALSESLRNAYWFGAALAIAALVLASRLPARLNTLTPQVAGPG